MAQTTDSEIMIPIEHPQTFIEILDCAIANLHEAFHRGAESPGSDTDRVHQCLFEPFIRLKHPHEFLQTTLDIRILFKPDLLDTPFLNANPDFLYTGVSDQPIRSGYASLLSDLHESFSTMLDAKIAPWLAALG